MRTSRRDAPRTAREAEGDARQPPYGGSWHAATQPGPPGRPSNPCGTASCGRRFPSSRPSARSGCSCCTDAWVSGPAEGAGRRASCPEEGGAVSIPPALDHLANAGALRYLGREWTSPDLPPVRPPAAVSDPYYTLGTHPDIVERLWAGLNKSLPEDCRWVVYRTPALVHPRSGAILAFGIGTGYALWLPPS